VLLSTHIVEDIAVLCPRVAILSQGRVVANTTPAEAREALAGTIYEGAVEHADLDGVSRRFRVTQALLVEGRNRVRIHVPQGAAPEGFSPVEPTLEDAYLLHARPDEGRGDDGETAGAAVA
jgi:ABC-type multidrug transport system ATPase subunit